MAVPFRLPNFIPQPMPVFTDEADPDRAEIVQARTDIENWGTRVLAHLTVLNPNHGFAEQLPAAPPANAGVDVRVDRVREL